MIAIAEIGQEQLAAAQAAQKYANGYACITTQLAAAQAAQKC